jgi:hypothetical protein
MAFADLPSQNLLHTLMHKVDSVAASQQRTEQNVLELMRVQQACQLPSAVQAGEALHDIAQELGPDGFADDVGSWSDGGGGEGGVDAQGGEGGDDPPGAGLGPAGGGEGGQSKGAVFELDFAQVMHLFRQQCPFDDNPGSDSHSFGLFVQTLGTKISTDTLHAQFLRERGNNCCCCCCCCFCQPTTVTPLNGRTLP